MKIRHSIIIFIALTIGITILDGGYLPIGIQLSDMLIEIFFILWIASLGLIAYLIIRNIFRAIKRAITGNPTGDYRGEARKACEKITPKKDKYATPPWEE